MTSAALYTLLWLVSIGLGVALVLEAAMAGLSKMGMGGAIDADAMALCHHTTIAVPQPPSPSSSLRGEGSIRDRCLALIKSSGASGYTADAVEEKLGSPHQTVSARIHELALEGLVIDSGQRRPTRRDRQAVVYVATLNREAAE